MERKAKGLMLILSTILSALSSPAMAAECHTLREARTQWPNTYLRYATEGRKQGGAKCWSPGGATARVIRARLPVPRPAVDMTPQQRIDTTFRSFVLVIYDPPGWAIIRPRQDEAY